MSADENAILQNWKLKIAIVSAFIIPTASAVSAYFTLESKSEARNAQTIQRIQNLELDAERNYVPKQDVKDIQTELKHMRDDLVEIKTLLKSKNGK